ncbi:MAG: hypothetical protein ACTSRG_00495 [Candidatus Helarchaeota archaeon]
MLFQLATTGTFHLHGRGSWNRTNFKLVVSESTIPTVPPRTRDRDGIGGI